MTIYAKEVLWIVRASDDKTYSEITYVYARTEKEARERAKCWLEERLNLPYHYFVPFPGGFQVGFTRIPGEVPDALKIEED